MIIGYTNQLLYHLANDGHLLEALPKVKVVRNDKREGNNKKRVMIVAIKML